MPDAVLIKTTLDGRKVEVIGRCVCLDGQPEAEDLVVIDEHPNRQAILRAVPGATHVAGRMPLEVELRRSGESVRTVTRRTP